MSFKKALIPLEIPGFDGRQRITIKVQRPRILAMAAQGKIPNRLMTVATRVIGGAAKSKEPSIKDIAETIELYCRACMVEPTFDEIKDIITDDQMSAIFGWATSEVDELASFRGDEEDGRSDNDGEELPGSSE